MENIYIFPILYVDVNMEEMFRTVKKSVWHISFLLDWQDLYFTELVTFSLFSWLFISLFDIAENRRVSDYYWNLRV